MDRRTFLCGLTLGTMAAPLSAETQQPRVARIGVVTHGSPATSSAYVDAFRQRLRELGYVEGRNVAIEVRAVEQAERFRELAAELVGLGVDVIVASGTATTRAAKEVTTSIPIVMVSVGDAVGAVLVKSLPRPGGNITGQSFLGPDIAKRSYLASPASRCSGTQSPRFTRPRSRSWRSRRGPCASAFNRSASDLPRTSRVPSAR
jgi:putative ABC transport system substrate-binding protein